jgi:hypothetical protein
MLMDVYKRDNAWHVELDLPGIDLESIDLTVEPTRAPLCWRPSPNLAARGYGGMGQLYQDEREG